MATEEPSKGTSPPEKLSSADKIRAQLIAKLNEAEEAASKSQNAKDRAEASSDPDEKAILLEEAAKEEKRAKAANKAADRLQSGVWQGGAGGGGIGAGIGAGVGAAVGTLVGGVAAIPTTGLGMLVGVGAGAVHGPWITMKGKGEGKDDGEIETLEEDAKVVPLQDK